MTIKQHFFKFVFTKIWRWKVVGTYPKSVKKFIICVGPHTSFFDVPIGVIFRAWYNVPIHFIIKAELFNNPISASFLSWLGGIPVDRSKANNFVHAIVDSIDKFDRLGLCITPEGTRKKVKRFKSGFYYIACRANIPVLPVVFDFAHKALIIHPLLTMGDDVVFEIDRLQSFYKGVIGKHRHRSFT